MQDDDFDGMMLDGLPPLDTEHYSEMFVTVCAGVLDELDAAPMGTDTTTARIADKVCERLGYDADDLGTWGSSRFTRGCFGMRKTRVTCST